MKFISFYSGSKGNASAVVSDGGTVLLIDCGVSMKKIKEGLAAYGLAPEQVSGILLTHEHSDHVGGLSMMLRHYDLKVYCNRRTALALPYITQNAVLSENESFTVGDIVVERFATYHDAAHACGYCFFADGKKFAALTDCGKIDSVILEKISGADLLYIESNYDETMLKNGPYPRPIQNRILSDRGHLSNKDCADTVTKLALLGLRKVVLGHISENNNTYMLAAATTTEPLRRLGLEVAVSVADESDIPLSVEV